MDTLDTVTRAIERDTLASEGDDRAVTRYLASLDRAGNLPRLANGRTVVHALSPRESVTLEGAREAWMAFNVFSRENLSRREMVYFSLATARGIVARRNAR